MEKHAGSQTGRPSCGGDWQAGGPVGGQPGGDVSGQQEKAGRHSDILTPKQSGRLTGGETDRQTDRWGII